MVQWESKPVLVELWDIATIPVWQWTGFYRVENQVDELKAMAEDGARTVSDAALPGGEGNDLIIMIMMTLFAMTAIGLAIYLFEKMRRNQPKHPFGNETEHVLFVQDDEETAHIQTVEKDIPPQDENTTAEPAHVPPQAVESYTAMAEALPLIKEDIADAEEAVSIAPREATLHQSPSPQNVVHINPTPCVQETEIDIDTDTDTFPAKAERVSATIDPKDDIDSTHHDVMTKARDKINMDQPKNPDSKSETLPYIAPIVKDDLARADARNDERMATLRSDMSLQIERFKVENNNRLDVIMSALDNKIDDLTKLFASYAKIDTTSRTDHPHLLEELQLLREKIDEISKPGHLHPADGTPSPEAFNALTQKIDALNTRTHQEMVQPLAEQLDAVHVAIGNQTSQLEQKIQSSSHNVDLEGQLKTVDQKIGDLHNSFDGQTQNFLSVREVLEERLGTISYLYSEVGDLSERVNALNTGIDSLHKATKHSAVHKSMAIIQLTDVIRSTLHEDEYEFGCVLSNHHQADCMVHLPTPPGPIAIDSQFPVNAYNALPPAHEVEAGSLLAREAENDFRRAMLKHIIDVASTCIIPEETANVALIFIPTEEIYTTIHSRFPDLIRDSFRSCVWLISPATLMGSLHTIKGILKEVPEKADLDAIKQEKEEVLAEIDALRAQAQILASTFANTQMNLNSLLTTTNQMASKAGITNTTAHPVSSDAMVPPSNSIASPATTKSDTALCEEKTKETEAHSVNPYSTIRMQSISKDADSNDAEKMDNRAIDSTPSDAQNLSGEDDGDFPKNSAVLEQSAHDYNDGPEWPGHPIDKKD